MMCLYRYLEYTKVLCESWVEIAAITTFVVAIAVLREGIFTFWRKFVSLTSSRSI